MVPLRSLAALALPLTWLAAFAAIAVAARPVAALLFPRFHDRGAALALPVGLAGAGLVAYWVGQFRFGLLAPVAGLLAVAVGGLGARRLSDPSGDVRDFGDAAVVFSLGYAFLLGSRALDPSIVPAGGEKFLDSSLLYSLVRTESLPPIDPWFAGEPVRYYYGGHMLAAMLARVTATAPRYAYNLALAGFYATLVTAAYGLGGAIAAAADRSPRIGGGAAAILVGVAGNLAPAARLGLGAAFRSGTIARETAARYGTALFVGLRDTTAEALAGTHPGKMAFWDARYVVEGTLTPFPLWAYVNGDLNAYMLSTPFLVLSAAVCFAYWRTPAPNRRRRRVLVFGALPAVGGMVALVNTWALPTVVGLAGLTLALAPADPAGLLPAPLERRAGNDRAGRTRADPGWLAVELRRVAVSIPLAVAAGAVAVAWAGPFLLFHTAANRGIGLLPPRSRFWPLVLVHGLFLLTFALLLFPRAWRRLRSRLGRGGALATVVAGAVLAAGAALAGFAAVALVGPFLLVGWVLLRRHEAGFATLLLVAGAGLVLAVEFLNARVYPYDMPRWNTVFKVYMQVWVLFGVGAGAALARLLGRASPTTAPVDRGTGTAVDGGSEPGGGPVVRVGTVLVIGCLVLAGVPAVYGVAETVPNGGSGPVWDDAGLDGLRYAERAHPDEARAIAWLREREGRPVIVAEPGDRSGETYSWVNAPSSLTGLPTLAGWEHEEGYRGEATYHRRVGQVRTVYEGPWPEARAVLARHDVSYVYVGPNEREAYDVRNFADRRGVTVAYRNPTVVVYDVSRVGNKSDA